MAGRLLVVRACPRRRDRCPKSQRVYSVGRVSDQLAHGASALILVESPAEDGDRKCSVRYSSS